MVGGIALCAAGDLNGVTQYVTEKGWHPKYFVDKNGSNGLMWAAGNGHAHIVRYLLNTFPDMDVNAGNGKGRTALMQAAKHGQIDMMRLLIGEYHADPNIKMNDGSSLWDWAVFGGSVTVLEYMINNPIFSIGTLNRFGCSAAHWAASAGNVVTCKWLFAHGIDFNIINYVRHGVVCTAVWKGWREVVEWFVCDVNGPGLVWQLGMRDLEGRSVVEIARMAGHAQLAVWLEGLIEKYNVVMDVVK